METSVLDFIDSDTLREHLINQTIEPAIECILLARSRKCSIQKKIHFGQKTEIQKIYKNFGTQRKPRSLYVFDQDIIAAFCFAICRVNNHISTMRLYDLRKPVCTSLYLCDNSRCSV